MNRGGKHVALIDLLTPEFMLLAGMGVLLILAAVAAYVVGSFSRERGRARQAEIGMEHAKLQLVQRRQELEDLERASHVLSDEEKQRIDALREDVAVLSRRNLALRGEVEARLTRLERAVEHAKMAGQLNEIKQKEQKLFTLGRVG